SGDLAGAARAALPAQRMGQLVPGLSRRASGDRSTGRNQARARDRLQLEGRTRRRDALAGTVRQSLLAGAGRLRRAQGDRLGHLRGAGDLPGRCRWHRALEARRPAGRREDRTPAGARARRAGGPQVTRGWIVALAAAALSVVLLGMVPSSAAA